MSRSVLRQQPDDAARQQPDDAARQQPDDAARQQPDDAARWRSRRGVALGLRMVVLLAPISVSVVASFGVTRVIPAPIGLPARVGWLAAIVVLCGLLAWPARRGLRRLLPLAMLLELSILFPGEAPTRWTVAREAGAIKHLEFLAAGVPDVAPVKAATTILALVASLARHDRVTRGHSERVRVFTDMIGDEMGLPRADRDRLRWAALIHDIGKLEIPARLLRKPGKPTASEWDSLRLHPETGARLAAPMADWLGRYAAVVLEHHERYDGTGYPAGLRGEQITLGGRIVGLADAFETMTAARPYKKAFSRTSALREVVRCSGTHFDPAVVRALLAVSTPRLRRALGPASWIGQLPVVGTAPVGGLPAVAGTVARGAGTVMLGGVASAVVVGSMVSAVADAAGPGTHSSSGRSAVAAAMAATGASVASAHHSVGSIGGVAGRTGRPQDGADGAADGGSSATQPLTFGDPASAFAVGGSQAAPGSAANALASATPAHANGTSAPAFDMQGTDVASGPGQTLGQTLVQTLGQTTSGVGGMVGQVTAGLGGTVGQVTAGLGGTVDAVVGGVGAGVGGPLGTTLDGVGATVGSTVGGLGSTVGSTVGGVGDTVAGLLGGGTASTPTGGATAAPSPAPSKSPSGLGAILGKLFGG